MEKRILFLLLFLPLFLISQNKGVPYQKQEYCKYKISFGLINAGYGELTVVDIVSQEGVFAYHIIGQGRTAPFFDWFFKVRDTYETYIDTSTKKPVVFNRNVYEGGHVIKQKYFFNHNKEEASFNNSQATVIYSAYNDKTYFIADSSQDMLSAFFFARTLDKKKVMKDSLFSINIFMDEEAYILDVRYLFNEIISTKFGKIDCMVFQPRMQKGRVFAEEEKMRIWISDDLNRLLLKVETEIWAGTISAKLIELKNPKYPLQIIDKK